MSGEEIRDGGGNVEAAEARLQTARDDLNRAVALLPDNDGRTSMASIFLRGLLDKVKSAKRHLERITR